MTDPVARLLTTLRPITRISLVIFGAVLIHLSLGTYHTFGKSYDHKHNMSFPSNTCFKLQCSLGNMLPYMASYMRNRTDASITIESLIWIPTFQGIIDNVSSVPR